MDKPGKNLSELIQLLRDRGLPVEPSEEVQLTRFLLDVNYYRASGYWRYFQVAPQLGDNTFKLGTTLNAILDAYDFDLGLRNILLEGLSVFEIAFRSRFAYFYTQSLPEKSYLSRGTYIDSSVQTEDGNKSIVDLVLTAINGDLQRSKEPFIARHRNSQSTPPIWVAVEAMSMGTVSKMYQALSKQDIRYELARSFDLRDPGIAESTFRSFTVLRNLCAHHARIWNRVPEYPHPVLKVLRTEQDKSVYHRTPWAWIVSLSHLVDQISRNKSFSGTLFGYINRFPELHEGLKQPHHR